MRKLKVIILASLDRSANQERAINMARELRRRGFVVSFFDSKRHFSHMVRLNYFKATPGNFFDYFNQLLQHKVSLRNTYPLLAEMKVRGKVIADYLRKRSHDIVICQNPQDMICLLDKKVNRVGIYDAPTIYSEEIRNLGTYSSSEFKEIAKIEEEVFKFADGVTFHWQSFFNLARQLKKSITKPIKANWGCRKQKESCQYSKKPKIVYLGKLNASWINPPLLEKIQKTSPFPIKIFSYEEPDKRFGNLQFSGYLRNLNKLINYQYGLVTISDDRLRCQGFSAKHLLYLSYGLPVLCPEWRKDRILEPATIYYNEKNFNQMVKYFSQKQLWIEKHQAALALSKKLEWEKTIKPFVNQLRKMVVEREKHSVSKQ